MSEHEHEQGLESGMKLCHSCGQMVIVPNPPQQTPQNKHEEGNYGYCKKCGHSIYNGELCPGTMGQPSKDEQIFHKPNCDYFRNESRCSCGFVKFPQLSKEGWEESLEHYILKWESEGRTEEQKWAVRNFLSGAGANGIQSLLKEERRNIARSYRVIFNTYLLEGALTQDKDFDNLIRSLNDHTNELLAHDTTQE